MAATRIPRKGRQPASIDWGTVDPWLRTITNAGALSVLSKELNISKWSLWRRRKTLGLPPLPKGRPPEREFTEHERKVRELLGRGYLQREIAEALNITRTSVESAIGRIREKEKLQALYCETCEGRGVVVCRTCTTGVRNVGSHFHVCEACGGNSASR